MASWIQQHTFSWIHSTSQLNPAAYLLLNPLNPPTESSSIPSRESTQPANWIIYSSNPKSPELILMNLLNPINSLIESNISNDLNQNPEFSRTESLLYLRFIFFKQMWLKIFLLILKFKILYRYRCLKFL